MDNFYKITFLNNLKNLFPLVLCVITLIIGFKLLDSSTKNIIIILIATFPLWGSMVFIHLEYLMLNWGAELIIDREKRILSYKDKMKEVNIRFDEIIKVVKYEPPNLAFLASAYSYHEIILKDRENLIITSLMVKNLNILGININKVSEPVPSIYLSERESKK